MSLSSGRLTTNVFTTPHATPDLDPDAALLSLIQRAKTSIFFAIYSITLPDIAQAIITAHQSGVCVKGVVDATEASYHTSQVPALVAAGVDLRVWGHPYHLMHAKLVVVDGDPGNRNAGAAWGSFNWSVNAEAQNVEIFTTAVGSNVTDSLAPVCFDLINNAYNQGAVFMALNSTSSDELPTEAAKPVAPAVTPPSPADPTWLNPSIILAGIGQVSAVLTLFFHKDFGLSANAGTWAVIAMAIIGFGAFVVRAVKHHQVGMVWAAYLHLLASGVTAIPETLGGDGVTVPVTYNNETPVKVRKVKQSDAIAVAGVDPTKISRGARVTATR